MRSEATTTGNPATGTPGYRPDIDGLRAIAVASVVGFHAFPGWLRSGFVGVDVFFVISGYLITGILLRDLAAGRFSILHFYDRRIRRIFPALALVLLTVLAVGWFTLLPDEYRLLGKHVAGGAAFAANLLLWAEAGYFDVTAGLKPLLHLWSLGVEEQFYLLWPLLLWAATRWGGVAAMTLAVATASFAANLVLTVHDANDAFYLPVARFWELMLGAWLARAAVKGQAPSPRQREAAAAGGAALLLAGFLVIVDDRDFPGWRALLPTLGTALLILAGPQAWFNRRVLALKPMVMIGLISYPLYLWHWPLLSFARIFVFEPSPELRIGLCALAVALAWLTYALIEKPVRHGQPWVVPGLAGTVAAMGVAGALVWGSQGAAGPRFAGTAVPVADLGFAASVPPAYENTPIGSQIFTKSDPGRDFFGETGAAPRVAVLGDSHASRLYAGLTMVSGRSAVNIGRGTCPPIVGAGVRWTRTGEDLDCQPVVDRALAFAMRSPEVTAIVLTAYFSGFGHDRELYDVATGAPLSIEAGLARTLAVLALSGKPVVVALDVPHLPSACVRRGFPIWRGIDTSRCRVSPAEQAESERPAVRAVHDADTPNVSLLRLSEALCSGNACGEIDPRNLLYARDGHHLTVAGARRVGAALERALPSP